MHKTPRFTIKMTNHFIYEGPIIFIIPMLFELVVLIVFYNFVRGRYRLYREIKRIPSDLLFFETYQNHLKNLKIKSMIHNFVIIILCLELINNTLYIIVSLLNIIRTSHHTRYITLVHPEMKILEYNKSLVIY